MLIAGSVDLIDALLSLSAARAIFHSEADLQQALAWHLHELDGAMRVRLETRASGGERIDLLLTRPDLGISTALELKYLCAGLTVQSDGEMFRLPNQGGQDIRAYDVVKDITRVERCVRDGDASNGAVVVLTNERAYWTNPGHGRATGADAFRIYEGTTLSGTRAWGPRSAATAKGRPDSLVLTGTHHLEWRDFSEFPTKAGLFRALVVDVR